MGKLVLAERDVTVHVVTGPKVDLGNGKFFEPHESKTLRAGESIEPTELPTYLRDSVAKKKAPGLSFATEAQVKKFKRDIALQRGDTSVLEDDSLLADEEAVEEETIEKT